LADDAALLLGAHGSAELRPWRNAPRPPTPSIHDPRAIASG
jgi:hypothetical protein